MGDRFTTIDMGRNDGGDCCAPFRGRSWAVSDTMWPGSRSISIPSGILIHPAVWPQQAWAENWGTAVPLLGGAGSACNTMWPGRGLPPYQVQASWAMQPFGRNTWAKIGGAVPLFGGSPSNTMSPGPRSTSAPNGILIHLAVWPQQTWAKNGGSVPLFGGGAGSPLPV